MKKIFFLILITTFMLASCDDSTEGLGGTLTDISDNVEFSTNEFNLSSASVKGASLSDISARSSYAYLGKMYDGETQSYLTADFMTQVIPLSNQFLTSYNATSIFPDIDSVMVYDDAGTLLPIGKNLSEDVRAEKMKYLKADSCYLTLYIADFKGDSTAQMSVNVKELSQPYVESKDYPITFNPETEGMIRTDAGSINALRTYSIKNMVAEGTSTSSSHSHYVTIPLNKEYTGRDGVTYSNYGTYIMKQYLDESAAYHNGFNTQVTFLKNVCPGFYLKHIGGEGAIASVTATSLTVYYRMKYPSSAKPDSIHKVQALLTGTEESIQHSTISDSSIDNLVSSANSSDSYTYVKSPDAIYTQLTIDVNAIMQDHENDSLSTVRIFLPCVNNTYSGDYATTPPATLLLLPNDSIKNFFDKKQVSNSRTSYLATYSSTTNGYTFNNIASLVTAMYHKWKESGKTIDEYSADEQTKDWNKVLLVPVETTYSTISNSSVLTKVSHSMEMESTRLKKGTADNGAVKASVIYTKYKQ
ncbi:MAG: DUF4270 domain-containing protein [Prevotella sp.]|nr:DUF4270 domain-containing protein [Prevotella sp.]